MYRSIVTLTVILSACAPWQRRHANTPCAPAYRELAAARGWLDDGDVARALAAADAADALCTGEPGRELRDDALAALGFPRSLRTAYADYHHALIALDESTRAERFGRPIRSAEAARLAAKARVDRGLAELGLVVRTTPAGTRAMLEALLRADRGDTAAAVARLDAVPPADRHPDLDVLAAALLAPGRPSEARRRAARALFAAEWTRGKTVMPDRLRSRVTIPMGIDGSTDRSLVAIAGGGVSIWRVDTGELVQSFVGKSTYSAVGFSTRGRLVAFAGADTLLHVADTVTGRVVLELVRPEDATVARAIVFGPGADEITLTTSEQSLEGKDDVGKLITFSLTRRTITRTLVDVPIRFGPHVVGDSVIVGNRDRLVAFRGDAQRWATDGVDAVSRDRDGVLRVVRGSETGTLDPATGTLREVQRSRGRVVWIGADSEIVRTATGALVRRANGGGIELGDAVLETDGDFVLVRDAGMNFLLDARTGRRIVDVIGTWPEPGVRFVGADRVLVSEAGELAMLGVTGTIKPCGTWWLASESDDAAITKPVAVQWSGRHAVLDPATCTVTRAPAQASPIGAGTEEVGGVIRGIPRIVEESSGDAVWIIGEQALVRRHRDGSTLRIATTAAGIDLAMEMEFGDGGLLDVDSANRNLRQVSAGGGRVALLWKTGSATVTDGTTRWHVPVGEDAAAIALAPDGKLLAAVGTRELVWFDVESGHVVGQAWRQGSVWRTRRRDRVVGAAVSLGQPSELVWRVEDIRLPGFVAWSRQGATR